MSCFGPEGWSGEALLCFISVITECCLNCMTEFACCASNYFVFKLLVIILFDAASLSAVS